MNKSVTTRFSSEILETSSSLSVGFDSSEFLGKISVYHREIYKDLIVNKSSYKTQTKRYQNIMFSHHTTSLALRHVYMTQILSGKTSHRVDISVANSSN